MGGSSSADNISPMHLIDIRKVAWGTVEKRGINDDLVELIAAKILEKLR